MDVGVGKEKIDCFICYFFFLENFRSCFPFCINHIFGSFSVFFASSEIHFSQYSVGKGEVILNIIC